MLGVREFLYTPSVYQPRLRTGVGERTTPAGSASGFLLGLGNYRTSYLADNGSEIGLRSERIGPVGSHAACGLQCVWFVFIGVGGGIICAGRRPGCDQYLERSDILLQDPDCASAKWSSASANG